MHIGPTQGHTRTDAGLLSVVECWMLSQPKCVFALWPEHKRQSQAAETCTQGLRVAFKEIYFVGFSWLILVLVGVLLI